MTNQYNWGADGLVSDHAGTQSRFYLFDSPGDARSLLDPNGNLLASAAYAAYETPIGTPLPSTPFGWQGHAGCYTDSETGLVFMEARYYSPSLGRFLSRDPIGFDGGINPYAYCYGDQGNYEDPEGTDILFLIGENHEYRSLFWHHAKMYAAYMRSKGYFDKNEPIHFLPSYGRYMMFKDIKSINNITRIFYFGHAGDGSLYMGHEYSDRNLDLMQISQLPNEINMCNLKAIYLFGCHTGDKGNQKISIAQAFANHYHVPVEGVNGKLSLGRTILTWDGNPLVDISPRVLRPTKGFEWFYPNNKK
jgi:RHS repeat-associated protein